MFHCALQKNMVPGKIYVAVRNRMDYIHQHRDSTDHRPCEPVRREKRERWFPKVDIHLDPIRGTP